MKLNRILAVSVLALAATGSALASDRGELTLTEQSPGHLVGDATITPLADGSFNDFFHFDAGDLRSIGADISSLHGVTWDDATLVDGAGHSYSFTGSGDTWHGQSSGGDTGYYTLHLQGHVDTSGHNDGGYGVHVTAVPEPETVSMLLAGLGLLGLVVNRRRKARSALA